MPLGRFIYIETFLKLKSANAFYRCHGTHPFSRSWHVLTFPICAHDLSRDTYACPPITPIYTLHLTHEVFSFLFKCLYINTHSCTCIAFSVATLFNTLYSVSCLLHDNRAKGSPILVEQLIIKIGDIFVLVCANGWAMQLSRPIFSLLQNELKSLAYRSPIFAPNLTCKTMK